MQVELRLIGSDRLLERLDLDGLAAVPHPGRWLELASGSYLVLQRRHRYQLRNGRYELATVALEVRPQQRPPDARLWHGAWVIGDPSCRFNARSPLIRCAVLPDGPCERCVHHSPRT